MQLTSSAFHSNGSIPPKHTCDGEDVSPELFFAHVPAEAQSLVLIMDDPDVPRHLRADGMWDHWVVFNIPPHTTHISENTNPHGTLGKNSWGDNRYQGPAPPDREHRYFFKLYALDTKLSLPQGATKHAVEQAMQGHILAQAELMGRYVKKP